jgi:transposase
VRRAVEEFGVDLSGLMLDMTNFATYIDSGNDRAPIAQRGHAKQKRTDLRIVGLGLVVSVDGGVPLVSHAYAGNRPDVTQFAEIVRELAARFSALAGDGHELTIVFDAGQNSAENIELLDSLPLHFVGSLPPSDHPELLAVGTERYRAVERRRFPGLTAFETKKVVFGSERRIVVTHSETLHQAQVAGFAQTLAKARRQLAELQARLARGHTRRGREKVEAEIGKILAPRWLGRVVRYELTGETPAEMRLSWRTDQHARHRLESELFGKRILFSDKMRAKRAEIVAAYRSQATVEADFRQMKDQRWSRSRRCSTSPSRRSASTSSTACSPSCSPG